jgi:hypothetical protein
MDRVILAVTMVVTLVFLTVAIFVSSGATEKLLVIIGADDLHEGSVIENGDFSSEIVNDQENSPYEWWLWEAGTYGISGAVVSNYGVENGYAFLEIGDSGPDTWHIQFNQWIELANEQSYLVSFKARADIARSINAKILQTHEPWTNYLAKTVLLSQDWQTYEFYYTHSRTADKVVTLCFELGKDLATTVFFSDVVVKPIDKSLIPVEEKPEEVETVDYFFDEEPDDLISNGDFSVGIMNDQASMPFEWWIWQAGQYGISDAKVANYGVEEGHAYLALEATGPETWHIQFNQWINVKEGNSYRISLRVKSDIPRTIQVKLVQTGAPYGLFLDETLNLTEEWQIFEFDYVHPGDGDPIVTFSIELGKETPTTVYFDSVSVKPVVSE